MTHATINFSRRKHLWMIAILFAALQTAQPAMAELEIQEPEVEAGEVEFEIISGWATDRPKGDDLEYLKQSHEAEIELGINNFLKFELGAEFEEEVEIEDGEKEPSSLKFSEIELGVQLELLNVTEHGIGLALVAGYTAAQVDEENDSINWGAIAKLASGPVSLTVNGTFSDPRTDDAEEDHVNFGYGAQAKYQINEMVALAAEAFGEIDNVYNPVDRDEQVHQLGPVLYLSWERGEESEGEKGDDAENGEEEEGLEVTLGLGALFGLTDVTPDTSIKAILEIEF